MQDMSSTQALLQKDLPIRVYHVPRLAIGSTFFPSKTNFETDIGAQ